MTHSVTVYWQRADRLITVFIMPSSPDDETVTYLFTDFTIFGMIRPRIEPPTDHVWGECSNHLATGTGCECVCNFAVQFFWLGSALYNMLLSCYPFRITNNMQVSILTTSSANLCSESSIVIAHWAIKSVVAIEVLF